jgi:hypothetical protein
MPHRAFGYGLLIHCLFLTAALASSPPSGPKYPSPKHDQSHGGHYEGGTGSSHKGGHYKNPATHNHYGRHRKP